MGRNGVSQGCKEFLSSAPSALSGAGGRSNKLCPQCLALQGEEGTETLPNPAGPHDPEAEDSFSTHGGDDSVPLSLEEPRGFPKSLLQSILALLDAGTDTKVDVETNPICPTLPEL